MIVFPNCKINLGLDILSRRPDGYHDLSMVMVPVPWCDILEIVPAAGKESTLTLSGNPVNCPVEKNLVMRALRLMQAECGVPEADIFLRKVVPEGAGLGGGSADAAFCLTALNSLFSAGLSEADLCSLAARLGADCPMFVVNRPVLATGIGTDLTPIDLDLSGMAVAIVKPKVSVPTAEAYSRVVPSYPSMPVPEIISLPPTEWQGLLKNDFEPSVFSCHPELALIKETLIGHGAIYSAMSGSGSAIFGLFGCGADNLTHLTHLTAWLTQTFPDCTVFAGKL